MKMKKLFMIALLAITVPLGAMNNSKDKQRTLVREFCEAISWQNLQKVKELSKQVDVNSYAENGILPILIAVVVCEKSWMEKNTKQAILEFLIKKGAHVNAPIYGGYYKGCNVLHAAIATDNHSSLNLVPVLIKAKVNINQVAAEGPYKGKTPLEVAKNKLESLNRNDQCLDHVKDLLKNTITLLKTNGAN